MTAPNTPRICRRGARGIALAVMLALWAPGASADPNPNPAHGVLGHWLAHEGDSSILELYLEGDALAGRILQVTSAEGDVLQPVCEHCPGDLEGRPITGLRFLWGLRLQDGRWVGGHVIDLRDGLTQGTIANAEIAPRGDTLVLHAYLGVRALGQTRIWTRPAPVSSRAAAVP